MKRTDAGVVVLLLVGLAIWRRDYLSRQLTRATGTWVGRPPA